MRKIKIITTILLSLFIFEGIYEYSSYTSGMNMVKNNIESQYSNIVDIFNDAPFTKSELDYLNNNVELLKQDIMVVEYRNENQENIYYIKGNSEIIYNIYPLIIDERNISFFTYKDRDYSFKIFDELYSDFYNEEVLNLSISIYTNDIAYYNEALVDSSFKADVSEYNYEDKSLFEYNPFIIQNLILFVFLYIIVGMLAIYLRFKEISIRNLHGQSDFYIAYKVFKNDYILDVITFLIVLVICTLIKFEPFNRFTIVLYFCLFSILVLFIILQLLLHFLTALITKTFRMTNTTTNKKLVKIIFNILGLCIFGITSITVIDKMESVEWTANALINIPELSSYINNNKLNNYYEVRYTEDDRFKTSSSRCNDSIFIKSAKESFNLLSSKYNEIRVDELSQYLVDEDVDSFDFKKFSYPSINSPEYINVNYNYFMSLGLAVDVDINTPTYVVNKVNRASELSFIQDNEKVVYVDDEYTVKQFMMNLRGNSIVSLDTPVLRVDNQYLKIQYGMSTQLSMIEINGNYENFVSEFRDLAGGCFSLSLNSIKNDSSAILKGKYNFLKANGQYLLLSLLILIVLIYQYIEMYKIINNKEIHIRLMFGESKLKIYRLLLFDLALVVLLPLSLVMFSNNTMIAKLLMIIPVLSVTCIVYIISIYVRRANIIEALKGGKD